MSLQTFAVLVQGIVEEARDPVGGNGKRYSCCDLQGVDADHLPVLKETQSDRVNV